MTEFASLETDIDFDNILSFSYDFDGLKDLITTLVTNQKQLISQVEGHSTLIETQENYLQAKEKEYNNQFSSILKALEATENLVNKDEVIKEIQESINKIMKIQSEETLNKKEIKTEIVKKKSFARSSTIGVNQKGSILKGRNSNAGKNNTIEEEEDDFVRVNPPKKRTLKPMMRTSEYFQDNSQKKVSLLEDEDFKIMLVKG